jgi:branched-chain amino acid transport system substrate-binding protein
MKRTLIAACLAALLPVAASAQVSDNMVKIGVLTDMSGVYSDLGGQGSVAAANMAVEDFIAAKKPKFKIEVVSADHQNKPDVASNKVREWYDRDGVDMVTDLLNSGVALAAAKVTAEKNKVLMVVGAGSTRLTNEDCTPNTIHWAYDTYSLAAGTARAVTKQGGNTWFFLTADYAFGASLESDASNIVKASGGQVLGSVKHPLNASDFSSFLLQAQASKAKVIGLANAGGDTINSVKTAVEFGITKNQSLAPLLLFISDIHAIGLPTAQGMYLTEGFYWNLNEKTRAWSRRYFGKMKRMPTMVQAGVYSSVWNYLNAVQAAGTDEAGAVVKKLKSTTVDDFFAPGGKVREDGRMVYDMYLFQVKKPSESKEPWDYYNVVSKIPASEAFQPLSASRCSLVKK